MPSLCRRCTACSLWAQRLQIPCGDVTRGKKQTLIKAAGQGCGFSIDSKLQSSDVFWSCSSATKGPRLILEAAAQESSLWKLRFISSAGLLPPSLSRSFHFLCSFNSSCLVCVFLLCPVPRRLPFLLHPSAVRGWLVGACKNDLLCFKWKTFPMKRKKWRFLERDGTSWTVMFSSPAFANTFQNSTSCDQMIFPTDPLSKVYFVQWMTTI